MKNLSHSPLFLFSDTFYALGSTICDYLFSSRLLENIFCLHRGSPRIYQKLSKQKWCTDVFYTFRYEDNFCSNSYVYKHDFVNYDSPKKHFLHLHSLKSLYELYFSDKRLSFADFSDDVIPRYEPLSAFIKSSSDSSLVIENFILATYFELRKFVQDNKITSVVCFSVSEVYSLSLEIICNSLSLPFRHIDTTRISNLYYISSSRYSNIALEISKSLAPPTANAVVAAKNYINSFKLRPSLPSYEIANRKALSNISTLLACKNVLKATVQLLLSFGCLQSSTYLRRQSIRKFQDLYVHYHVRRSILRLNLFSAISQIKCQNFILFPLHVIPEKSTAVDCPTITSHYEVLKRVLPVLPDDYCIVVKEHCHMLGWRKCSFYQKLSSLPNVILADPYSDNFELISLSRGVMSINGTSNFEALLMGKPQLSFANAFYSGLPSSYLYNSEEDLQMFVNHCVRGCDPSQSGEENNILTNFVALMYDRSFPLEFNILWSQVSSLTFDEQSNFSRVARMLSSHLFNLN